MFQVRLGRTMAAHFCVASLLEGIIWVQLGWSLWWLLVADLMVVVVRPAWGRRWCVLCWRGGGALSARSWLSHASEWV